MHAVAHRPIGAVAAPAIALNALCLDRPLAKFIHPPARLSSHIRAKLEAVLPIHRSSIQGSQCDSPFAALWTLWFLSSIVTGLALSLSCLLASLLQSCLLTKPFALLTHPQSIRLDIKDSLPAVAVSGKRRPLSASSRARSLLLLAATPYSQQTPFLHQRGP